MHKSVHAPLGKEYPMRDATQPSSGSLRRTARLKRTAGELLTTPHLWKEGVRESPYLWAGKTLIASSEALERTAYAIERRVLLPLHSIAFRNAVDDTSTQRSWCINPYAQANEPGLFLGIKGSMIYQTREVEEGYVELVLSRQSISVARHIPGGTERIQALAQVFTNACNLWLVP